MQSILTSSPTPTRNSWSELPDSDDEETLEVDALDTVEIDSDVLQHLSGWAHRTNVLVRPKPDKAEQKSYTVLNAEQLDRLLKDKSRISKLASVPSKKRLQKIKDNLPNIPLEDDEILVLVDSGSTINAADIAAYFPEYVDRIIESRSNDEATTAGGHKLANEGRCRIEALVDGHAFPVPFQNMKVDVPILSVRKYVRNGFGFHFEEHGGYMESRANGRKFHFIEADGAYWIKMKVQKPKDGVDNHGFTRLGRH